MRPNNSKKIKKTLRDLKLKHSFHVPLQVIFDKNCLELCEKTKIPIRVFFKSIGDVRMFATKCIFDDIFRKEKSTENKNTTYMDAHIEIRKCKHSKKNHPNSQAKEDTKDSTIITKESTLTKKEKIPTKLNSNLDVKDSLIKSNENEGDTKIDSCLKNFFKYKNENHYILACTSKSSNLYSGLENVPLLIIKKGGMCEINMKNFQNNKE